MTKSKANGIDIFNIDPVSACDAGADIELVHPASQRKLGIFLRVLGHESKEYSALERRRSKVNFAKGVNNRKADKTPEELAEEVVTNIFSQADTIETATLCTVGWWRFADPEKREGKIEAITFNGEELAFSKEAAGKVFTERPWIAVQAEAGVKDLRNFLSD